MKNYDDGYSFIETLIALAITIILSAAIGIPAIKYIDKAKVSVARTQIESFRLALDSYYIDCGDYPSSEQGLNALVEKPSLHPIPNNWDGPYMSRKIGLDPWGNAWQYKKPGDKGYSFEIKSFGKNQNESCDKNKVVISSYD